MSQVAILGCGPAGLLAAEAVVQKTGETPVIFSVKVKSHMPGAIYLHEPIPNVTEMEPEFQIKVVKSGTKRGYAEKVYGNPAAPCSWDKFQPGYVDAWDLGRVYDLLWREYEGHIIPLSLDIGSVGSIVHNFPLVLSTIPAESICNGQHDFRFTPIKIEFGRTYSKENTMCYNGLPGSPWYRYSQIQGHTAWEFGPSMLDYIERPNYVLGKKPIDTDCDCWLKWGNFHRLGRFGKWRKGVLTHHAYQEALDIMDSHVVL